MSRQYTSESLEFKYRSTFEYASLDQAPRSTKMLVLQHRGRKVLCSFPETFEEALRLAREEFALGANTPVSLRIDMAAVDPLSTVGEVELTRRSWGLVVGLAGTLPITVVRAAPETGMIELFVKTLCSVGTFSLRLPATSTVSDLATAIENKKGIAFDLQRLILNQKGLELDRSLAHYNIQQHDTIHLVQKLQGGKPVIYLQSPQDLTATVSLSLSYDWSFSAIYPIAPAVSKYGQEHTEWTVDIKDNGAILHDIRTATDVSYLYWEALTNPSGVRPCTPVDANDTSPFIPSQPTISPSDSVLLAIADVPKYLDNALKAMTLNTEARTSFITYWLPSLLDHGHVALRFLSQRAYEQAAKLDVTPVPDVVTRVFMLFRGIREGEINEWRAAGNDENLKPEEWKEMVGVDVERASNQSLFRVLEWGGMEVKN